MKFHIEYTNNPYNKMEQVSTYAIPKGTKINIGPVSGGKGMQIYIKDAFNKGVKSVKSEKLN
jgi:hypothetical protein